MEEQKQSGFGAKLRELREAAGLTQESLAARAGMHRFGIAKLERGEREPSWATVRSLTRALGVNCLAFDIDESVCAEPSRKPGRPRKDATATKGKATASAGASKKPRTRKGT